MNAFLIPGGTPCIQMSCKQDREYREEKRGTGVGGGRCGPTGGIKTNAGEYEYDERDGKKNGRYGWSYGIAGL